MLGVHRFLPIIKLYFNLTILLLCLMLSHSVYAEDVTIDEVAADVPAPIVPYDPLEKFNRAMFSFNEQLDRFVLKPVATLYNKIMPRPLNRGIHNVFLNLNNVPTFINDVLQLHLNQAANDIWRLGINSTLGIGGLFDIAKRMGLDPYTNDFGMTMAYYGYHDSTYLVLPFFGPNTFRDAISLPVDYYAFSVYPYIYPRSTRYSIYALSIIDTRAQLLKYQSVFDEAAIDKYSFQRNAYLQRRAYTIKQNEQLGIKETIITDSHEKPIPATSRKLGA